MAATTFELRASQAWKWVVCTASRLMSLGQPDIEDPTVRDEGIAFHYFALMVWLGHTVNVGQRVFLDGMSNTVECDDAMIDAIDEYLDRIRTWGGTPRLEFSVAAPRIHPQCGGTTDVWSFNATAGDVYANCDGVLYVGDAKYGYRWNDPYRHWQCLVYVSGLLDHLGIVDDTRIMVEINIFQPRAYRRGGPWFTWRVRASDLRADFNTLRNAAEEALSDRAKCVTGPHCNNCAARAGCAAFDQAYENAFEVASEPIDNDLTPERVDVQLARVERAIEVLDAQKSAYQARAEMFIRSGKQMRNYELRPGRSNLRWKEGIEPALQAMAQQQGLKLFNQKPITPTQAKKVLAESLVDALSDRPAAGLKLVRVDEDRASRMFGQISEG
jgi:hypothetical protein